MSISTEINRIKAAVTSIAQAIRGKGVTVPTTAKIGDLAALISSIATPNLQSKTVSPSTSSQTVTPDSGYNGLSQVTVNAMPTATQATPSISVSSAGLITASATQTAGYVSAGTTSSTFKLLAQVGKTVTPTTTEQTAVAIARYTTGAVKVAGDANLLAANIKKDVTIFGVTGSYEGEGGGYAVTLPTRTVTVIDNDYAGNISVTTLSNEDGKLIWKSTNVPSGGSVTITYAWRTPIFIKNATWCDLYDAEGDYVSNFPYHYDSTSGMVAYYPQIDGGDNHTVYCYL